MGTEIEVGDVFIAPKNRYLRMQVVAIDEVGRVTLTFAENSGRLKIIVEPSYIASWIKEGLLDRRNSK